MSRKLSKTVNADSVSFEFANGESIEASLSQFSDEIRNRLALHGLSQKGGDSTAGVEAIEDCVGNVKTVIEQLIAGEWSAGRSGLGVSTGSLLVEALSRSTGKDAAECKDVIDGLDDDQIKALRKHAGLKAMMAEIRAERERAKAGDAGAPDLSSLF